MCNCSLVSPLYPSDYDGGDCCECTCEVPEDNDEPNYDGTVECGTFACIDPAAPCVDDDSVTVDMLYFCNAKQMGDGFCDISNNIAECGTSPCRVK